MASREMSRLNISLTASIAGWEKGLEKAANKLVSFVGISKKTTDALIGTIPKLTALFGGVGIAAGIKMAATRMDELAKASDRLGLTTAELAGFQHAADMSGSSAQAMTSALEKMLVNSEAARTGNKNLAASFSAVGVSVDDLKTKSTGDIFKQVAEGMKGIESSSDKLAITTSLFGKNSYEIANVIADGASGLEKMSKEAELLGLSVSRVDAYKLEKMNDSIDNAGNVTKGIFNQLSVQIAPVVTRIAEGFVDWVVELGGAKVISQAMVNTFYQLAGILGDVGKTLLQAFEVIKISIFQITKHISPVFELIDKADREFNENRKSREIAHNNLLEKKKRKAEELTALIVGLGKQEEDSTDWMRNYEKVRLQGEIDTAKEYASIWRDHYLEVGKLANSISENMRNEQDVGRRASMQSELNEVTKRLKDIGDKEFSYRKTIGDKTVEMEKYNTGKIYEEKRLALENELRSIHEDIARANESAPGLKLFDPEKIKADMDAATAEAVASFHNRAATKDPSAILSEYKKLIDDQTALDDAAAQRKLDRDAKLSSDKIKLAEQEAARLEEIRAEARQSSSLTGIYDAEMEKRRRESSYATTKSYISDLNAQTSALAKTSKAMFVINQGAATANAIMNTAEGVTKALTYSYPFNFILAGLVGAAGAAQIAAIASTSFGQKSGGGSATSGMAGAAEAAEAQSSSNIGSPRQQSQQIIIYGESVSTDQLLRMTEEARERGVTLGGFQRG